VFAHLDELEHPRRRRRRLGKDWREETRGGNEERESGMHVIFIFPLPPGWAGTEVGTAAATFTCEHRRLSKSCPSLSTNPSQLNDSPCPSAARLPRAERPRAPRSALAPRNCEYALARAIGASGAFAHSTCATHSVVCVSNADSRA